MGARNDQARWWEGKSEAEIQQHMADDERDEQHSRGNYRPKEREVVVDPEAFAIDPVTDYAGPGEALRGEVAAYMVALAAGDVAIDASRKGKRGRPRTVTHVATARAVMVATFNVEPDVNGNQGTVTADVARVLGVSDTSAGQAIKKLQEYVQTLEFRQAVIQAKVDRAE